MVTGTTTGFAIHHNGRIVLLDDASNQKVRQEISSDQWRTALTDSAGKSQFANVTLNGSMSGDRISVTTISK